MIKVAVVGTRGFPCIQGGVENHCEYLYTQLAKKGCNITVFTRKPYIKMNIEEYKGVFLVPINCPKNKFLEAITHTFKSIINARNLEPDILHIHGIGPSLFAPFARLLGMKVIVTNHGENYKHMKWGFFSKLFLLFCEAIGMLFSDEIIAITQPIALAIKKKYNRSATIIPNGVKIPKQCVTENKLSELGIEKHKYILSVGRLLPVKGFHDLMDAFNHLQTLNCQLSTNKWKLVIVGSADHEDKYSLGLKEKANKNRSVILTGFLTGEPLQELYNHAGLFVLPSYYEGLPIVLLEALSYGLSCIASDIPANRNIELSDDRFFKAGDVEALAGKITEFTNKPLTVEEKKRQISMIAERYDWEKIAEKTLKVYDKVHKPNQ